MSRRRVLAIANRGEIAVRIARTARNQGWKPVVLLAEPDWDSYAAREIEDIVRLQTGDELDPQVIVAAAISARATSLHPGYGFLSERPALSTACQKAGIIFVGPSPETLIACGDKIATRSLAEESGLPVLSGSQALNLELPSSWSEIADEIGYPVIAKVAGAGGGRGLRVARAGEELESAIRSALNEAGASGADAEIFLEHYLEGARHVEVQVAGDGGQAVALGDRDCSLQRRHQKVVEEAPAPGLTDETRQALHQAAIVISEAVKLKGVATIEFLMDANQRFYFMEINPRLQVEHTVTEEVTGFDLVQIQLELATGKPLPEPREPDGHAIQARLYAEDPFNQNLPGPGEISKLTFPTLPGLRVDTGYQTGDTVPGNYDPMVAKLIASGVDRKAATATLRQSLADVQVAGIPSNRPWLYKALEGEFAENNHDLATASSIILDLKPPSQDILGALATLIAKHRQNTDASAWSTSGPFRSVAPATMVFHGGEIGGWQEAIQLASTVPGVDRDRTTTIAPADGGGYELTTVDGRWIVATGPLPPESSASAEMDGILTAPMPGTVLAINVEMGQDVSEGDVLAVLEAMKIEISLAAPFDGIVNEIHAQAGELVRSKQAVVGVAPHEDGDSD